MPYLYYEIMLNYFLLLPVGFLACVLLPRKQPRSSFLAILLICFSFMAIESSQLLLRRGLFELDDIIGNVIGGIIGYVLCAGLSRLAARMRDKRYESGDGY